MKNAIEEQPLDVDAASGAIAGSKYILKSVENSTENPGKGNSGR